jgi:crotonobetainyl-CoA:carnitine CoA-transferase CaiB-like acyl-CoA transferase
VNPFSAALDLQNESLICYLNGEEAHSIRFPQHMAGWYYTTPYGIYPTRDGHLANSLGGMRSLGKALGSSTLAAILDDDA